MAPDSPPPRPPPHALCSHLAEALGFCAGAGAGVRPRGPCELDHRVLQRLKQRLGQHSPFLAAAMVQPPQQEEGATGERGQGQEHRLWGQSPSVLFPTSQSDLGQTANLSEAQTPPLSNGRRILASGL